MARVVSTTWFEELGYMHQPIFDVKVTRLSLRQMIYVVIFGILSYFVYNQISTMFFSSLMFRAVPPLTVFVVGMGLFAREGKVFAPEWYLVHFVKTKLIGESASGSRPEKKEAEADKREDMTPRAMTAPMGEPTRIAGVLYDPSTGKRMDNAAFEVMMEGEPYHAGTTDGDGAYSLVFTPPSAGTFELSIKPKGHSKVAEEIEVSAKPTTGTSGGEGGDERTLDRESVGGDLSEEGARPEVTGGRYIYELFPMNFADLSEGDQDSMIDNYRNFLNSLPKGVEVKIHAVRSSKEVKLGETTAEPEYFRFFIESEESLDAKLDSAGFQYQRTTKFPDPDVMREFKDSVAVEGGRNLRAATVCELGQRMVEGFPSLLYRDIDRFVIKIKRLEQGEAVQKMDKFVRMQQGLVRTGKTGAREETKAKRAEEAINRLTEGGSRLFRTTVNVAVGGDSMEELDEKYERVESTCNGRMVEIDDPMFVQTEMLKGNTGKELIVDTVTLGSFFPFVSADVMETPGGVFLGANRRTGAPVLFDPYIRSNQNMAMIGVSGGGKSYASKIYLTRLFEKHPDMAYFVIDPENEYTRTCDELDATTEVVPVSGQGKLGLDPLKIFSDSKEIATEMLVDLLSLSDDEPNLLSDLRVSVQGADSLEELREEVGNELEGRLDGILEGSSSFLFEGESWEMPERAVFNLEPLHESLRLTESRTGTLHTASLLLFGRIWNKIEELPRDKPKIVVVDEVWLYTGLPASAAFLEQVSRRGRKRNVILLLASQRPADVLESGSARAALENCATKVIFKQDETAKDLVGDTFDLTEKEVSGSTEFSPGEAILKGDDIKVPLNFSASREEHRRFTTEPEEV